GVVRWAGASRCGCAYCNQLMGIARRKAGTVVRCPTCSGQVVVPDPGTAGEPEPEPEPVQGMEPQPALFERSDFDEVFDVPLERPAATMPSAPSAPPGAWGTHAGPALADNRLEPAPFVPPPPAGPRQGIVLTTAQLTMLAVGAVLLLAAVFGAGVLVGRLLGSGRRTGAGVRTRGGCFPFDPFGSRGRAPGAQAPAPRPPPGASG